MNAAKTGINKLHEKNRPDISNKIESLSETEVFYPSIADATKELKVGCARPTGGLVGEPPAVSGSQNDTVVRKEAPSMIKVGKKAPDFTAPAYSKGEFVSVQLSEYLGKWVLLCFYPGDFTFV